MSYLKEYGETTMLNRVAISEYEEYINYSVTINRVGGALYEVEFYAREEEWVFDGWEDTVGDVVVDESRTVSYDVANRIYLNYLSKGFSSH